jgi:hypothetical protein
MASPSERGAAPAARSIAGRRRDLLAGGLSLVFDRVLLLLALTVAASWLILAIAHINDRAFIAWDDGARMGLAQYARRGILYPPLFENGVYGGTRFMPIPIMIHAGLSWITGEFLASGKLMTYLSFAAVVGVTFLAMRQVGCSPMRAAALIGAVSTTWVAVLASLGISHDPLPIALQLSALMIAARSVSRRTIVISAVLCAAALFAKLSALWAVAAIGLWLWRKSRRWVVPFLGAFLAATTVGYGVTQVASGGRFADNLAALSTAGIGGGAGLAHLLDQVVSLLSLAPVAFGLLPLGAYEAAIAARRRSITVFHLAFLCSVAILLPVLTDQGASINHFLDPLVLAAILTASLWQRQELRPTRSLAIAVILVFGLLGSFSAGLGRRAWDAALGASDRRLDPRPLDGLVRSDDLVLAEDASIVIALGHVPVVLDPFMLPRIGDLHPEWLRPLVDRLERREFDRVVVNYRLDSASEHRYTKIHFGASVTDAIRRNYVLLAIRAGFAVYAPRQS